ncbi:MAG: Prolyl oligopeptidase, partial [Ramlibacter sp.]|nr:Prolyl oligopeptidase [Ramlibacter sp.]
MTTPKSLFARAASSILLTAWACGALAAPPVAPVRDVPETLHGVTVHDPYRYFENIKAPEVQSWLLGQGAQARQSLDHIEGRAQLEKRIAEIAAATGDSINSIVRMPGERVFYLKRGRTERQFKLVMRTGARGAEKVLVDPEVDAKRTGVPHAVNYFVPSWDGKHVAYGMSVGGSEDASLYILDVASGKQVGAPIARVHENAVSWLPDSKSLTYNQLKPLSPEDSETETYLDSRVMWLQVGAPESAARAVFGPTVTPQLALARLDVGSILFTPGSRWMIARTTDTTLPEGSLFVARVSELGLPKVPWKKFVGFQDKIVDIELKGDELYFRTHKNSPRYKIMKLDLRNADLARASEVALPPEGGVLEGFVMGRQGLVASVREGTSIGMRRYLPGDVAGRAIPMPVVGAARVHDDPAHAYDDVLYTLAGWTQLPRTLRLRGNVSTDAGLRAPVALPALPDVEVVDVKVPSYDGVLVPMTVLYKKGLKRDGSNPTLLDAYGSYGHTISAYFSPGSMAWLEQGGVLAIANVRGSGVYGEPWRMAGFKANKPNTWKDGVACAEYLIQQGYATPRTLGVMGTSAGGIFVGRTVTTAPHLFAAAIFNVGVMDAVRAEESANGITNISEFGSYKNPLEFPALLAMSTYHQIQDGTPYPAVMAVHGLNDPRVDVWQSAKVVARLQAASSSGKPVLLRIDAQAGHGMGS